MTTAGTELLAEISLAAVGLWIVYDNWPSVWGICLETIVVFLPMIVHRIPRRH
jgi:hypothetical protein